MPFAQGNTRTGYKIKTLLIISDMHPCHHSETWAEQKYLTSTFMMLIHPIIFGLSSLFPLSAAYGTSPNLAPYNSYTRNINPHLSTYFLNSGNSFLMQQSF